MGNVFRLAQPEFAERLVRALTTRLRVIYEAALAEVELWNKTAASQLDAQLRDRRRNFSRRLEAMERIQQAAAGLDERIAEPRTLERQRVAALAPWVRQADWVLDDQPVWLNAQPKPVLSVPYTVELNDIPMMLLQQNRAEEMLLRGIDQFERLWQESEQIPRVMAISVHPYVTGVAHRIGYFEKLLDHIQSRAGVVIRTGEQISNWYREQVPYSATK